MNEKFSLENFINKLYYVGENYVQEGFFENIATNIKDFIHYIKIKWEDFLFKFKRFLFKINPFITKKDAIIAMDKEIFKDLKNAEEVIGDAANYDISDDDIQINDSFTFANEGICFKNNDEVSSVINKLTFDLNNIQNKKNNIKVNMKTVFDMLKNASKALIKINKNISKELDKSDQKESICKRIMRYISLIISLVTVFCKVISYLIKSNFSSKKK